MITDSDGASDLPLFLTAPLYRRWHLRWGSTTGEVVAAMPGDALLPTAQFVSTRSITIDATPDAERPWLVQVGCGRAGFYSNDLLVDRVRQRSWPTCNISRSTNGFRCRRHPLTAILGVLLMEFGDSR